MTEEDALPPEGLAARWWMSFTRRHLVIRILAGLAWMTLGYMGVILLVAGLYTQPQGQVASGPVYVISRPMSLYIDLRDMGAGRFLDALLGGFCLFGVWVVVAPFIPKRKKPDQPPPKVEARPEVELGAAPVMDEENLREVRQLEPESKESESDIPEHIRRLITRFVDIQTLQPRGVLRSVIILLHSDIESYRHLLKTPDCLRSLEKLRKMPADVFDNDACREMLAEEGYDTSFSQLGLEFSELVPTLIERIEGQLDESFVRVNKAVAESSTSLGVSWYVQNLVTRFIDLRTLQPVGVLRSVLILLSSNVESYRDLLKTPECKASLEKLRTLPDDFFENDDCREMLGKKKYAQIYERLNLPLNRLAPTLVERIEGERSESIAPGS